MKISKKDQETLLEKFKARPPAPSQPSRGEVDFTKQLDKSGDKVEATIRADRGTVNEGTALQFLKDEGLDPSEYEVTGFRKSQWSGFSGEDMESVRFTFRKVGSESGRVPLPDLDDLHRTVKKSSIKNKLSADTSPVTEVCCLADTQIGKTASLGGTEELLRRLENSKSQWISKVKRLKPEEIIVADLGDSIEGFENVASQHQTNDLRLTEMLRVWRRVFWSWVDEASRLAPSVKVVGVPSNHARVRKGKSYLSEEWDDYGIEVLSQIYDLTQVYPEKYSHVEFYSPEDYQDSVALPSLAGPVLGFAHGDQVTNPKSLPTWLSNQSLGNTPVGSSDILLVGHWHHPFFDTVGSNRSIIGCSTSDGGSSWYSNRSGNSAKPGVTTLTVDSSKVLGWHNLEIF